MKLDASDLVVISHYSGGKAFTPGKLKDAAEMAKRAINRARVASSYQKKYGF